MRAFVTGGSGVVGQRLITALCSRGDTIIALARSKQAVQKIRQVGAEPVYGELDDSEALTTVMRGCDTVFHCAAILDFSAPVAEQERVNIEGTRAILAASQQAGVSRFVFVSAASILVTTKPLLNADETWPVPQHSIGTYSRTKAEAERLVLATNTPTFTTVAVRPPFVWGVLGTGAFATFIETARKGRFVWFDHGNYPYATCHIDNVIEGLLLAAEKGTGGQAYFLTDGPPVIFRDFATALLQTQHVNLGTRSLPRALVMTLAATLEDTWNLLHLPGVSPLTCESVALLGPFTISDAKARQELGYTSAVSREQGLLMMSN